MKEKIIDFSNGIFSYDQVRLTTEPERIEIEMDPGKGVKGDLIVSSQDERRVKGMIFSRVPGLTFRSPRSLEEPQGWNIRIMQSICGRERPLQNLSGSNPMRENMRSRLA